MSRTRARFSRGVGVAQQVNRKRGGAAKVTREHSQNHLFVADESIGSQELFLATPQSHLDPCAGAQRGKAKNCARQRRIRREALRIGHRTGAVHVDVQVQRLALWFVSFGGAPNALDSRHARNNARALEHRLQPVRFVQRVADVPRFKTFGQWIGAPGTWTAWKGNQVGPGAFAVITNGGVMVGNVESGRAQDFAELKRLARLTPRRSIGLEWPGRLAEELFLFGTFFFWRLRESRIQRGMHGAFPFAGFFFDQTGRFAARRGVAGVEEFLNEGR